MPHPADRYYAPNLTPDEVRAQLRRDHLLLRACQASLGLVGRDVLGLAVEPRPGEVVLHAAVVRETPDAVRDLHDIASELKLLLVGGPDDRSDITTQVHVGLPCPASWPGHDHALVYLAKWDEATAAEEERETMAEA
ncbi:hypothetical protein F0L17_20425 [Streptomyces sp. TRM43335]|uniref:Uncharacterized protein n=1 Tax=Streptomyces taklimakanensis TaxID=2569853 RepID=A0A6G2BGN0_9ACTN|nr:hypothetical protein [Streptomyces taklimakanensis]MTE21435.1 hypothetical protein [Streptomyces taklimakanensis]